MDYTLDKKHIIKKYGIALILIMTMLTISNTTSLNLLAQESKLVFVGEDGKLVYTPYANFGEEEDTTNIVPDFSWAGYKFSEVPIPDIEAKIILEPQDGDDHSRIQAAIDELSNLPIDSTGFRGALLLKAGYYEVRGPLYIRSSGIVIKGEGQASAENGGTHIQATGRTSYDLFNFFGPDEPDGVKGTSVRIIEDVPTGTNRLIMEDASSFEVGDLVHVLRTPNQKWIDDIEMGPLGWTPSSYTIFYERSITAISGDTMYINVPVVQAMTEKYGLGEVYKYDNSYRINNVGIENMYLNSFYIHSTDENHANRATYFQNVEDGWVRRVTAKHFARGTVTINWSYKITVEDCALVDPISKITGSRRYSFEINKGSFNLFQRIYTRNGRHDQVTGSRVAGPNVYVDNYSENSHNEAGPHHRYATGLLMDNVRGGDIRVRNRGFTSGGSGHGWSGAQVMFWNVISSPGHQVYSGQPYGARSWAIGSKGDRVGNGYFELNDQDAQPRSLFYQQLQDRIGKEAVDAMTTETQKNGTILRALKEWKGEGYFDPAWVTSNEEETNLEQPQGYFLKPNYPNPFNPSTQIEFGLAKGGYTSLNVYNTLGQKVHSLVDAFIPGGLHQVSFNASNLPSGMYFYTLQTEGFKETKSMLLVK